MICAKPMAVYGSVDWLLEGEVHNGDGMFRFSVPTVYGRRLHYISLGFFAHDITIRDATMGYRAGFERASSQFCNRTAVHRSSRPMLKPEPNVLLSYPPVRLYPASRGICSLAPVIASGCHEVSHGDRLNSLSENAVRLDATSS